MTIPANGSATLRPVGTEHDVDPQHSIGLRDAGFPLAEGACLSGWLQGVRRDPLIDFRSSKELPQEADAVVIGSGATGTLVALELLKSNPHRKVILLEAREFCSGATGRNAGHCRPDIWRGYVKYSQEFGKEQAMKILANEQETYDKLKAYIMENKVDCEAWFGNTLDVMTTDDIVAAAAQNMDAFKDAGGDASGVNVILDPEQAEKISRVKGARAVYGWNAATLYPWKLVAHVAQEALDLGLQLHTWTPVSTVEGVQDSSDWNVKTSRGIIRTPMVVHATNAYAPALLPETKGAIEPVPHMCNRVYPPPAFAGSSALKNSYCIIFPDGNYTVNPRQGGDGLLLVGGTPPNLQHLLDYVAEDPVTRSVDDGLVNFDPVTQSVKRLGGEKGFGWDVNGFGNKAFYDHSWSGIIGESADMLPFIGAVPRKPGQWICAGHNGHGMARIFTCAPGLVKLINGGDWASTGLPECFEVSEGRLLAGRAKVALRLESAY
ncbi:hypothetical protein I316_05455 [Kwoniella heveanensis BCC8398]|uniref:FAD dependent oxidoreductase domain-containing protein n=1 Tax=Kwoniella heveanensis BCC8398 TaxID=1296120 RepID=A0A1B9GNZ7_9TREE|nr:hypothetical protein I316_05455 [Kwoniella heveanensis BCC8398]